MFIDLKEIRRKLDSLRMDSIIVLKNDAYGLGLKEIASFLIENGFYRFAVISIDEAIFLRMLNKNIEILLLGNVPYDFVEEARSYGITLSITSANDLGIVTGCLVHIKINTGMNRFGICPDEMDNVFSRLSFENQVTGIYSHISSYLDSYNRQLEIFKRCTDKYSYINRHLSSSKGIGRNDFSERVGFFLYDSAITVSTRITYIRSIKKSEFLGYDFKAEKDMLIGIINMGYYDGLGRGNEGRNVMINRKIYKIVGHICMNNCFIEIDNTVRVGDQVFIINNDISLYYVASYLDTTPYEVLTSFKGLPKKYFY